MNGAAVERQVSTYRQTVEEIAGWAPEQTEEAMVCHDLEDALEFGLHVYKVLMRRDLFLRSHVRSGKCDRCSWESLGPWLESQFRGWLEGAEVLHRLAVDFTKRGYDIVRADELRSRVDEVSWSLKPAEEALGDDALIEARDAAIDALHQDETLDLDAKLLDS